MARLVGRIARNIGGKNIIDADLLDVSKSFETLCRWSPLQVNAHHLAVLHSLYILILTKGPEFRKVIPHGHFIFSSHSVLRNAAWVDFPYAHQSVCQRHSLPIAYCEFTFYSDGTSIAARFRKLPLIVGYVMQYFHRLQWWMKEYILEINPFKNTHDNFARAGRRFIQPRPLSRLICSSHIDQLRKSAAQRLVYCVPLNRKRYPTVTSGVML